MSYTHLTIEERCCLREYYLKGYSYRKIATLVGRNVSTVSRELRRNRTHMTKEEKHLWYDYLREYPVRFIRQKLIGKYIKIGFSLKSQQKSIPQKIKL